MQIPFSLLLYFLRVNYEGKDVGVDQRREGERERGRSIYLPSSHGGGVLPGNQRGLSVAATADTERARRAVGAVHFFCLNFVPPRKDAFVAPSPFPVF